MPRQQIVSRLALAAGALTFAFLAPLPLSAGPLAPSCADAAAGPSVALVVDFGNVSGAGNRPAAVVTRCVAHQDDMSGAQALVDAGFELRLENGLLCAIDKFPATGCGEKTGARKYLYWSYWKARPGENAWGYSGSGVDVEIRAGVSEGWRFVEGSGSPSDPRPGVAPDHLAICGPLQPESPSGPTPNVPSGAAPGPPVDGGFASPGDGGSAGSSTDTTATTGVAGADSPGDVPTAQDEAVTAGASAIEIDDFALEDAAPATETSSAGGMIGVVAVVVLIAALGGAALVRSKRRPRVQ